MFDIGWTEMLVVAVVMILVVGPKDLPGMLRTIGKSVGNVRRMAGDFQRQFSDALKEAEIDEVKKELAQSTSIPNPLDDINKSADELMSSLDMSVDADDAISADILDSKAVETPAAKKPVTAKKTSAKEPAAKKVAVKKPAAKKITKAKASAGSKSV